MGFVAVLLTVLDPWSGLCCSSPSCRSPCSPGGSIARPASHYRSTRVASANLIVHFVESMAGIRALQAFRRERPQATEEPARLEEYREVDQKSVRDAGQVRPWARSRWATSRSRLVLAVGRVPRAVR